MHLIVTNATTLVINLITGGDMIWCSFSLILSLSVSANTADTAVLQHITTVSVEVQIA